MNPEMIPQEEKLHMKETVNGISIECRWDDEAGAYILSLPDMPQPGKSAEGGHFAISEDRDIALRVFEFAKEQADGDNDVLQVFIKAEHLARALQEQKAP